LAEAFNNIKSGELVIFGGIYHEKGGFLPAAAGQIDWHWLCLVLQFSQKNH